MMSDVESKDSPTTASCSLLIRFREASSAAFKFWLSPKGMGMGGLGGIEEVGIPFAQPTSHCLLATAGCDV